MSNATFVAYIDESGCEGFSFNDGSSEWFVLSAVVVRKSNDNDLVKVVRDARDAVGVSGKKALHFRKLDHREKGIVLDFIMRASFRCLSVFIHKPSLMKQTAFQRYRLHHYALRLLLERVSWLCRDSSIDRGDGSVDLVFSLRDQMCYEEIRSYLHGLNADAGIHLDGVKIYDIRLAPGIIKPDQMIAMTARQRAGLQIVDFVASSAFASVDNMVKYGLNPAYTIGLSRAIYAHKGYKLNYGLKFFPLKPHEVVQLDGRLEWITRAFK